MAHRNRGVDARRRARRPDHVCADAAQQGREEISERAVMKVGPPIALKPRRPLQTTSIALPHDSSYGQQWRSWIRFSNKTIPYYYGGPSLCLTTRAASIWMLSAEGLSQQS
jgi:hypothetical protein